MAHGHGKRKAGRPKGTTGIKWTRTLLKEQAREEVRQELTQHLGEISRALVKKALGVSYLVHRDRATGKFAVVSEAKARKLLESGNEVLEVWSKEPHTEAIRQVLDRAIDRPKEQLLEVKDLTDWD